MTFDELSYTLYTWPTASVEAMAVFRLTSSDGGNTVSEDLWIGYNSHAVGNWSVTR